MRKIIISTSAAIILTGASLTFADKDDPNLDLISARQSHMTLRSYFLGPLVGMAKGEIPYDAGKAAKLAGDLKLLGDLDVGSAWAPGTDKDKYPNKTTALASIWASDSEIADYGKKYHTAVDSLANAAGNGLDQLRATIGDVGDSCKGCHDEYREKE